MARAVLAPQARRDLLEAARWIAKENRTAAAGLRQALIDAAIRIGEHARIGTVRAELADDPIRFLPMTGFLYVIVYDSSAKPPLILRVLHGARDIPEILRDL